MKKHQVFKIGLHVLLVFHITFIYGQIQPSFQHITTEDGLVSNSTLDIFQDHIGFLWIGMYYGLQRFDGYQYKTYICNLKFPDTVNFGGVVQTLEDSKGNLWIATNNFGILKFDRKTNTFNYFVHDPNNSSTLSSNHIYHCFLDSYDILWVMHGLGGFLDRLDTKTGTITRCRNYPDDPNSISHNVVSGTAVSYWKVKAIYEDKVGDIWIGTHGGGLNRFNRDKNTFSHFRHNPSDPKTLGCDTVMYILEDDYGNLWIATWGGGLDQYIRMSNTFKHHIHNVKNNSSLANDYCYYIFREDSDNLWVSVLNGFDHLSVASGEFSHFKHGQHKPATLIGKFYLPFYIDENRNLWVFNGEFGVGIAHLILYNDKEGEVQYYYDDPNNPEGLRGLHIGSVIQDYTGIIWIPATPRGIDSYDPYKQYFHQIHHQPYNNKSLICNNTKAILESKFYEGVIWIGTHEGLELYNRKTNTFTHISCNPENPGSISNKFVTCLHEDRDGRLWIGTSDGLYCYNYRNQWFTIYKHDQQDTTSIGVHTLWNMIEDHEGNLWITSLDGVLIEYCRGEDQFNNYRYTFSEPVNTYPDLSLWCVFEDNDYNIWVGSTNGLSRFERNKKRFNYVLKGISVHVIFPDDENNFWLGTALNGLCHFNRQTGETVFYDETKGLCNNAIHAIIDDKKGNLWIATEGGLSRFNIQSRIFTNFYKEHGLPTELFDWKGTLTSDGRIWLTTIDQGIVTFTPEQVKINETPPKIVLTDFRVFNESLAQGEGSPLKEDISVCKEIHLEHWQNDISIECTALHFSNPQKNQYAFWLENYDDDWYKNGTNRTASYTNLNPGEYIFHARAANSDNIWYTEGISLRIIINPPWWKTAWAYISYILTLILIVFLVWKQQMRRVQLRHELRMKQFEAEKLHEVDQLKSRFFVNISHEFRTPLTLIIGPLEQLISEAMKEKWKKQLKLVYNNSRQLLQLINQLLDFSKLEEGRMTLKAAEVNIIPLLKGLVYSFDSMARRKKIELTFHSEYEHIPVYVDKDKLEKIVSNLLSNAFKFTAVGGKIAVKAIQIPGVEEKNSILEIHVSDTGLGIGKEHLSHIFDRYYQADKKRRQTGTGIGLALVKELVELHHGHITAESEPGKGSLFILQLPLGRAHLTSEEIASDLIDEYNQTEWMKEETMIEEVHTLPVKEAGSKDRNKPLILVVEDTEDVRIYIRDLLISGYRVAEADDGETGLEKAFNILPDLIISDVMLPGMDGFVLCEKLKTDEHTSHIPIILLTARASEDSKLEGLETGADDYLVKPFNSKELKVRIGNLIEQRRKLRERFIRDVNLSPKELAFTSADERFLEKALSIIENRMSDPLFGVGDLSKEINMSISSLYRKILALTGQSPIEFIRTFRLKRAANLLKQKYGNIAQITYEVGFNNPSYFARCFRQQYGVSPSEYAKIL